MNEQAAVAGNALPFQNREVELDNVIGQLIRERRPTLVIAMPNMGKSRFLSHLPEEMQNRGMKDQHHVYLNLSAQDPALRNDLGKLLQQIFPAVDWDADPQGFAVLAAQTIAQSRKRWLILLDNADFLTDDTARNLRRVLCDILHALQQAGQHDQLAFVASSRVEIPAFKGVLPEPYFSTVSLSQFGQDVIARALKIAGEELGVEADESFYQELGRWARDETEGLPGLLVRTLAWVKEDSFALARGSADVRSPRFFETVVKPYVEDTLLSPEILVPERVRASGDAAKIREIGAAFAELVLWISVFRIITRSHLKAMAARHQQLRQTLQTIQTIGDPYDLLSGLSIAEPKRELWCSPYRAVRRLYFRYKYSSVDAQVGMHREAQDLYDGWAYDAKGDDAARLSVEMLWHEVEAVRLSAPADGPERIERCFETILKQMQDARLRKAFGSLVRQDEELLHSLNAALPQTAAQSLLNSLA